MQETNWFIQDWNETNYLFTYSEEEKQNNEINKQNAKLIYSPKFIPFYPKLVKLWLDIYEAIIYWFIDFYLSWSEDWRFYFTNEQISNITWVSERKITNVIKKLKDIWLINPKYKVSNSLWKIRFINKKDFVTYENATSTTCTYGLARDVCMDSHAVLGNNNKNKQTIRTKEKKSNIHETSFAFILSSFWLSKLEIEKRFEYKKPLDQIIRDCEAIRYISEELCITPIYDKETINATDIMLNKWYSVDDIIEFIKSYWVDDVETYKDLIRPDYYLPVEIDKKISQVN